MAQASVPAPGKQRQWISLLQWALLYKQVPSQPGLCSETLFPINKTPTKKALYPICWGTPINPLLGVRMGTISTNSKPACVKILSSREGKDRMKGREEKEKNKKGHQYSTKLLPSGSNMQFTCLNASFFQSYYYN